MIELFFLILWSCWGLLALLTWFNVRQFLPEMRAQEALFRDGEDPGRQQRAVVVIPVKKLDPVRGPAFFRILLNQRYADYRILVTMENEQETAASWLVEALGMAPGDRGWHSGGSGRAKEPISAGLRGVKFIFAGPTFGGGQKVHNQIEALKELEPEDRRVVFGDADMQCGQDWLARLTAPLNVGTHPVSTTYRWLVPVQATIPNLLMSVINAGVATLGGREAWNNLWGGSMALVREDFDALAVPSLLEGSLTDDLRLGKCIRRSGRRIACLRSLIVPTDIDFSWRMAFEFGRRQYYMVRHYAPFFFKFALIATTIYNVGFLSALWEAWHGNRVASFALGFVLVCDQLRALARWNVIRSLFPPPVVDRLRMARWMEHLGTPLFMTVHSLFVWSALATRTIRWAGIHYRVISPDRTLVLEHPDG